LSSREFLVIKLGGSLLTYKSVPKKVRTRTVKKLARFLANKAYPLNRRLALVHGGGSFGHYEAARDIAEHGRLTYGGFPRVSLAMVELNAIVMRELVNSGLPAVSLPPRALCRYDCIERKAICDYTVAFESLTAGLVPVLFGDIVIGEGNCGPGIVSGDDIAISLASKMTPARVIFAMDVDGIYRPSDGRYGELLREADVEAGWEVVRELERAGMAQGFDVTGGIASKLRKALECIEAGYCREVVFVSGRREEELYRAVAGLPGKYTLVRRKA